MANHTAGVHMGLQEFNESKSRHIDGALRTTQSTYRGSRHGNGVGTHHYTQAISGQTPSTVMTSAPMTPPRYNVPAITWPSHEWFRQWIVWWEHYEARPADAAPGTPFPHEYPPPTCILARQSIQYLRGLYFDEPPASPATHLQIKAEPTPARNLANQELFMRFDDA